MECCSKTSFWTKSDGVLLQSNLLFGPASVWEHPQNIKLWQTQFYINYMGKSSSESCVGLFITLCTGWILKARTRKTLFAQTYQKPQNLEKKNILINPPSLPLEGPYSPLRRALFAPHSRSTALSGRYLTLGPSRCHIRISMRIVATWFASRQQACLAQKNCNPGRLHFWGSDPTLTHPKPPQSTSRET